ncbi:hypothetical protein [Desulfosporosinus youngiae]|uniref:Uncharacterized protein n=1 Tax=Desulfosporosinus youngiae DSM 17734 TaxID=768710 RepID=H5Y1K8_9FIRM|nr:hypothetical protein [Desulfosporosinus youngiae]EHQ87761.1 hypothetical protein DesyoDRAFT_0579 [Desulfosporosinus youngiae DSM 17734]
MNEEVYGTEQKGKNNNDAIKSSIKKGISFGSCLAMIISYTAWKSIPWAIIHGLMSWVYVVYYWANYQ